MVVSAGPTYEDLDPVRYLGNRSSGKMGFALADSARRRRAEVVLVAGPVTWPPRPGCSGWMCARPRRCARRCSRPFPADIYIGAAAVADYTPRVPAANKIKNRTNRWPWNWCARRTSWPRSPRRPTRLKLVVGFAAETQDVEKYARGKLVDKRLDLMIANQVGMTDGGFESDENAATALLAGRRTGVPRRPRPRLAEQLLALIARRLDA